MITAEIISIGDELLIGQTVNTNASWLGQQLALIGIKVQHVTTISDSKQAIVQAFDAAFGRNKLIIVTGGLGPTKDDITKHVLCEYFDSTLVMNQEILAHISAYFTKRGRQMLETNTLQAALPDKCEVLFNRSGTAAGMWFTKDDAVLISMPGVPYEMKTIFLEEALPKIRETFATFNLYHRTILTQGIGESFLADQLSDWENRLEADGLGLAYLPSPGMVKLRITSYKGETDAPMIQTYIDEVYRAVPNYLFGEGEQSLPEVVGALLKEKGATVGTVESCTGGGVAAAFTSISGSSDYFQGALVTYSNEMKSELADVDPLLIDAFGPVSKEVIEAMAMGGRKKMGVSFCMATSGIAGPLGGTEALPVGTVWIAIAGIDRVYSKMFIFGDNRERNIQMSILTALNLLRCELLEINQ